MLNEIREKSALLDKGIGFLLKDKKTGEMMRYLLVGGSCAVFDMGLLFALVEFFHLWYLFSAILSFTMVSTFGYFGQKYFTFQNKSKNHRKQLFVFFVIAGIGLLINSASMFFFVSILSFWYILANAITKFIVLLWNFTANKYITFRH